MSKRFLGIVCLLYSGIIIYVIATNNLKNYLAPNMQIYLKVAVVPLMIMGLILCLSKKTHYHFKASDLILLLPLVMIFLTGNSKLTTSFASNRTSSFGTNKVRLESTQVPTATPEPTEEKVIDYEIIDANYNELANYITYPPRLDKLVNKRIKVSGLSLKKASYLPTKYTMIGKYSIYCCAADAEFIGFILDYDKDKIKNNTWYEVEGILEESKDANGFTIMVVKVDSIKEIDESKQEQYVYSCTNYGDGKCSEVLKYDLEY